MASDLIAMALQPTSDGLHKLMKHMRQVIKSSSNADAKTIKRREWVWSGKGNVFQCSSPQLKELEKAKPAFFRTKLGMLLLFCVCLGWRSRLLGWMLLPSFLVISNLLTRSKKLLGTKGIATRSKDATRGCWHRYYEQEATRNKGIATRSKDATRGCWHRY